MEKTKFVPATGTGKAEVIVVLTKENAFSFKRVEDIKLK